MFRVYFFLLLLTVSRVFCVVVVSHGTNTIQTAIADNPTETVFELQDGVRGYGLTSPVTINRPLTIRGQGTGAEVFTNMLTVHNLFQIYSSGVTLENFKASQEFFGVIHIDYAIVAIGSFFLGELSNIVINNIHAQYMQNVVYSRESSFTLSNCFFDANYAYSRALHTSVRLNGNKGVTRVENNTFNTVDAKKTCFMLATSKPVDPSSHGTHEGTHGNYHGEIHVKNNTQLTFVYSALQFYAMDSFNGAARSMQLTAEGNTFKAETGSFAFNSFVDNPADMFSRVEITNNTDLSDIATYKGLVSFDGGFGAQNPLWNVTASAEDYFFFSGNTLTNLQVQPTWEPFLYEGGLFGINPTVYNHYLLPEDLDDPAADPDEDPTGRSLDLPPAPNAVSASTIVFRQFREHFVGQTDVINGVFWLNPDPSATHFNIYKNSPTNFIQKVPAKPQWNSFFDHQQKHGKQATYHIERVSAAGGSVLTTVTGP